jgi:hypothetical protein
VPADSANDPDVPPLLPGSVEATTPHGSPAGPRFGWVQEMKTSALTNDRIGFLEAYRHAVDVARSRGEADPEQAVLESYKSRSPMGSVFAHKPTDVELAKLYGAMDETGQRAVCEATTLFDGSPK